MVIVIVTVTVVETVMVLVMVVATIKPCSQRSVTSPWTDVAVAAAIVVVFLLFLLFPLLSCLLAGFFTWGSGGQPILRAWPRHLSRVRRRKVPLLLPSLGSSNNACWCTLQLHDFETNRSERMLKGYSKFTLAELPEVGGMTSQVLQLIQA